MTERPHSTLRGVNRRLAGRAAVGAVLALSLAKPSGATQQVAVPSGQVVALSEVLVDDAQGETLVRFRFVAPGIAREGGSVPYDVAMIDMDHLCRQLVLPYLAAHALAPERVVLSMADRDVPFGEASPQATQFFEAYRLEGADCIWEGY